MTRFKGILFDKDGTLFEFETLWHDIMGKLFKRLSERYGVTSEQLGALKAYSGYGEEAFEKESPSQYLSTHELTRAWGDILFPGKPGIASELMALFEEVALEAAEQVQLLEGVSEILEFLKARGYALGIATADTWGSTYKGLKQSGILDYFDYVGVDDGVTRPKPHPEHALKFSRRVGIELKEMLIVGDSFNDFKFAQNAGVPFVGIQARYNDFEKMEDEALFVIHKVEELKGVLEKL
ncbi:MAG: hypothetical protein AVO33_10975 [delta proteobacterium ML8_F1]|nr:MAG: hypothetical protein AVO33_10975 [delta proteobacterium ML8_F1]